MSLDKNNQTEPLQNWLFFLLFFQKRIFKDIPAGQSKKLKYMRFDISSWMLSKWCSLSECHYDSGLFLILNSEFSEVIHFMNLLITFKNTIFFLNDLGSQGFWFSLLEEDHKMTHLNISESSLNQQIYFALKEFRNVLIPHVFLASAHLERPCAHFCVR